MRKKKFDFVSKTYEAGTCVNTQVVSRVNKLIDMQTVFSFQHLLFFDTFCDKVIGTGEKYALCLSKRYN